MYLFTATSKQAEQAVVISPFRLPRIKEKQLFKNVLCRQYYNDEAKYKI